MHRPVITEKLMEIYEIKFDKSKAIVNEYAPDLTKDEIELNRMIVKNILAKAFGKHGE